MKSPICRAAALAMVSLVLSISPASSAVPDFTMAHLDKFCSDPPGSFGAGLCRGMVLQTMAILLLNGNLSPRPRAPVASKPPFYICGTQDSEEDAILKLRAWIAKRPAVKPEPALSGILEFFVETYPCRSSAPDQTAPDLRVQGSGARVKTR